VRSCWFTNGRRGDDIESQAEGALFKRIHLSGLVARLKCPIATPQRRLVVAQILVVVEIGREHEIADQIRNLPGVTEIAVTYGQYDIVAKVITETMADLDRVVTLIRKIPGVLRTSTLVWSV